MSEPLLQMRGVVKTFDGVEALDGTNLVVRPGECVGLCGENGAGKLMLMKMLSGVHPNGTWDGGILQGRQPLRVGGTCDTERAGTVIVHQELVLVPGLSVTENIYLGNEITLLGDRTNYVAMYQGADKLLRNLNIRGIDVALSVMRYGDDHQQLIEIAKALNRRAELLIPGEPSLSLTAAETRILLDIVRDLEAHGIAYVYIPHKPGEAEVVCDTVTIARDGRHVATASMDVLTTGRIITQMVGREITQLFPHKPHPIGEVVLGAHSVTCYDANNPTRRRVDGVFFSVRRGEILGVAGLVGAGCTKLIQAVFGAYKGANEMELVLGGKPLKVRALPDAIRTDIAMAPEGRKRHDIVSLMSVGYDITLAVLQRFTRLERTDGAIELNTIREEMRRLAVRAAHPMPSIASLPDGNRRKAVLTRMLLMKPRVLILDKPTRGAGTDARYETYKLIGDLAKRGMVIVMILSGLSEVLDTSGRVLVIGEGQLRDDFVDDELTQEHILTVAIQPARGPPRHAATFHRAGHA